MLRRKALSASSPAGAAYDHRAYAHSGGEVGAPAYDIRPQAVLLLAALGALIGPFMPWISIQLDSGTLSQNGIDFLSDSAWAAVAIGALTLASVLVNFRKRRPNGFGEVLGCLVLALMLGGIDLNGFDQVGRMIGDANGVGLYVLFAASCALAIGGIWQAYVIGLGRITLIIAGATLLVLLIAGIVLALLPSSSTTQAPVSATTVNGAASQGSTHP